MNLHINNLGWAHVNSSCLSWACSWVWVSCQVGRWLAALGWPWWEQLPFVPCGLSSPGKRVPVVGQGSVEQAEVCKVYSWDVIQEWDNVISPVSGTKAKEEKYTSSLDGRSCQVTLQRTCYGEEQRMTAMFTPHGVTPYLQMGLIPTDYLMWNPCRETLI